VTKKLLDHYGILTPTISYHEHSKLKKINYILDILEQGKDLALVSDAGTPSISDPGNKLVEKIIESFPDKINIFAIPGPSAAIAAASVSGFPMNKFFFAGFPPTKKKRKKFFGEIIKSDYPVIFYESPYRIIKTLDELKVLDCQRKIVVCQEMTKKFETIYRGTIEKVIERLNIILKLSPINLKGEFVVILEGGRWRRQ